MLLKNEIEKLSDSLFILCSEKEKLFYHFMIKQNYTEKLETPSGDLDKICFTVYTNSSSDISKEIQRIAPSESFKHIHYSNSIITLIPVCLKSNKAKNNHLRNYFDSHSYSEKLLITKIFPLENLQFVSNPITDLDKLIDETFFNPQFESAILRLPKAFLEVNDIVGLLAFREAYLELLKIHPNSIIENKYSELSVEINKLISVISSRINFTVDAFIFFVFLFSSPFIVYILTKQYEELKIDKFANIWTFMSPIIIGLIFFAKKIFPKLFSFYDVFKNRLVDLWFKFHKVDSKKLSKLSDQT